MDLKNLKKKKIRETKVSRLLSNPRDFLAYGFLLFVISISGEPQDAQLRDLQAAGLRVEATLGGRKTALYRRGQADSGQAHDGSSGL